MMILLVIQLVIEALQLTSQLHFALTSTAAKHLDYHSLKTHRQDLTSFSYKCLFEFKIYFGLYTARMPLQTLILNDLPTSKMFLTGVLQ